MGADIHIRAKAKVVKPRLRALRAIQDRINVIDIRLAELRAPDYSDVRQEWTDEERAALWASKKRLVARREEFTHGTATRDWQLLGRVFEARRHYGIHMPATRENLEALTDGQLVDSLALLGRSEDFARRQRGKRIKAYGLRSLDDAKTWDPVEHWRCREFYEALTGDARAVFDAFNEGRDAHRTRLDAIHAEVDKEFSIDDDDEWGTRSEEAVNRIHELKKQARAEHRATVTLSPEARESIIKAAGAYRPYDDDVHYDVYLMPAAGEPPLLDDAPYSGQNYDLFAMLADVRNGGFRGEPRRVEPIAQPRGIPQDASPEADAFLTAMGVDGHSHSYLTLSELEAVPWETNLVREWGIVDERAYLRFRDDDTKPRTSSGWIGQDGGVRVFTPEGYEAWVERGRPYFPAIEGRSWMDAEVYVTPELLEKALAFRLPVRAVGETPLNVGTPQVGVSLGGIDPATGDFPGVTGQIVLEPERLLDDETPEQAQARLGIDPTSPSSPSKLKPYVRIEWDEPWSHVAGYFLSTTLPELRRVAGELGVGPQDIRLVFFFDN